MINAVRMLSSGSAIADFDREETDDSSKIFITKANLIIPYTTVDNDGHEVTYEVGQEILVSVPCGIAKVGTNHIRVRAAHYVVSHSN